MKTLYCFYDMAVSPCSYDFFSFLNSAENCRIRRAMDSIQLIFIHGNNKKFRQDNIRTDIQNETFFHNVIIPGLSILPSIDSYMWISRTSLKIEQFSPDQIFPRGYSLTHPVANYTGIDLVISRIRGDKPSFFEAPEYATNHFNYFLEQKLGTDIYVTLTTREISRDDKNNTRGINLKIWTEVAVQLKKQGIKLLVIRDTDSAYDEQLIAETIEAPELSIHLPLRLAAYEKSIVNFTKNNGPAVLQLFGRCKSFYFNSLDPEVVALTKEWYKKNYGMIEGSNFPMTTMNKKVIWEKENVDLILDSISNAKETEIVTELNPFYNTENLALSFGVALQSLLDNLKHPVLPEDKELYQKLVEINNDKRFVSDLQNQFLNIANKVGLLENGKLIAS